MGVGGINSCVISRPWDEAFVEEHVAVEATTRRETGVRCRATVGRPRPRPWLRGAVDQPRNGRDAALLRPGMTRPEIAFTSKLTERSFGGGERYCSLTARQFRSMLLKRLSSSSSSPSPSARRRKRSRSVSRSATPSAWPSAPGRRRSWRDRMRSWRASPAPRRSTRCCRRRMRGSSATTSRSTWPRSASRCPDCRRSSVPSTSPTPSSPRRCRSSTSPRCGTTSR